MRSIRRRLLASTLIGVVTLIVVVGAVGSSVVAERLRHEFDRGLFQRAESLASLVEVVDGGVDVDFSDQPMPEFAYGHQQEYFEIWTADGTLLKRSPSLGTARLPKPNFDGSKSGRVLSERLPNGRHVRLIEVAFAPQREDSAAKPNASDRGSPLESRDAPVRAFVVLARDTERLETNTEVVVSVYAISAVVLAVAIFVLLRVSVDRGLRPLEDVAHQISEIGPRSLHRRIDIGSSVEELEPIVERTNQLLANVERAMERETGFSADVAHELRTPVAELKAVADVASRWPDDESLRESFVGDVQSIASEMERVVEQLLALARVDADQLSLNPEVVHVPTLIGDLQRAVPGNYANGIDGEIQDDLTVTTDQTTLTVILRNIMANAVRYAPTDTKIGMEWGRHADDAVVVRVSNVAPHLCQQDVPRLFDRFWRKDGARTGGGHAGIGLALALALAQSIGARLNAVLRSDDVLTLSLAVPVHFDPSRFR